MEKGLRYRPGLNQQETLASRFARAAKGSSRMHLGVAYAKSSGVVQLLGTAVPTGSRAVVGLGFGLTDPMAVQQLETSGLDVRVVPDDGTFSAASFHTKIYLVEHPERLTAFSGSANLTGAGWTTNVEQFEELSFSKSSSEAAEQMERYEHVWDHGHPLALLRRTGEWDRYRQRARDRRLLEREDRKRLLQLQATTGQLVGALARQTTRAQPGYLGVTNADWWDLQLLQRDQTDTALFWRRNVNNFQALARDGLFFHLLIGEGLPESQRAVRGFSVYRGEYQVGNAREMFNRHGAALGVVTLQELHERLQLPVGAAIGIISLHELTELERPVSLEELRANGVSFARNIVSGKRLSLEELATVLELGGLGQDRQLDVAAEDSPPSY